MYRINYGGNSENKRAVSRFLQKSAEADGV